MSVRLGEILVKESLITQDQLQKALEFQRANGGKLGTCLTKLGFITDDDITGVLSRQYGVPSINVKFMTGFNVEPVVASEAAISDAISRCYGGANANGEELTNLMRDLVDE